MTKPWHFRDRYVLVMPNGKVAMNIFDLDLDYLNQLEAKAAQAEKLRQAVEALELAEAELRAFMPPAPNHYCGPESPCDMLCVDFAEASRVLLKIQRTVTNLRQLEVE